MVRARAKAKVAADGRSGMEAAPASAAEPGDLQSAAFPIVGIGASAGGLAAFEAFFSGMPADTDPGMALVLVQHLAPDHKSILTELIRRYTRMQVFEVEDGMVALPNCVYVIPPGRDMAFLNGTLQLLEPSEPRGHEGLRVNEALGEGSRLALLGTLEDQKLAVAALRESEAEIQALNETLETRVAERTAKLEEANRELESFSYSVSHDLRAPLRAISGFASILASRYRDGLDEKGRHYLDTIVDSSEHMGILIEELLAYSRMGRGSVRAEPVPLEPLVTGLRMTFGNRIAEAGGTLEVIEPLATPVGDPALIERILANLLDNALIYRRPDVVPHVTLSATRHGRAVTLAVADDGIGIPAEYRERIFEVFARLHADDEYPGTGIGLSIVRKGARLMGSDVTVESAEGVGSTFRLDLPAAQKRSTPS